MRLCLWMLNPSLGGLFLKPELINQNTWSLNWLTSSILQSLSKKADPSHSAFWPPTVVSRSPSKKTKLQWIIRLGDPIQNTLMYVGHPGLLSPIWPCLCLNLIKLSMNLFHHAYLINHSPTNLKTCLLLGQVNPFMLPCCLFYVTQSSRWGFHIPGMQSFDLGYCLQLSYFIPF